MKNGDLRQYGNGKEEIGNGSEAGEAEEIETECNVIQFEDGERSQQEVT